jgi:hypothetical protein
MAFFLEVEVPKVPEMDATLTPPMEEREPTAPMELQVPTLTRARAEAGAELALPQMVKLDPEATEAMVAFRAAQVEVEVVVEVQFLLPLSPAATEVRGLVVKCAY